MVRITSMGYYGIAPTTPPRARPPEPQGVGTCTNWAAHIDLCEAVSVAYDSAGTAHLSYGSSKRSDSGASSEHTAVTVDATGLTAHRKGRICRSHASRRATASRHAPRHS